MMSYSFPKRVFLKRRRGWLHPWNCHSFISRTNILKGIVLAMWIVIKKIEESDCVLIFFSINFVQACLFCIYSILVLSLPFETERWKEKQNYLTFAHSIYRIEISVWRSRWTLGPDYFAWEKYKYFGEY